MKRPLIFFLVASVAALSGCSHSADRVPDYHTLLGKKNVANMNMAVAKCNESATAAERATNPWCGVVQKANRCMDPSYFGETPATACPAK
ncbi:MAG: hypothetical protein OJF61_002219 [Rhodanobacteraceae bacterium]|jgi:hypothetical protein|nr:MAG: hypothetical protein OJF61_002219 [Rhodanobacteraceae bacterium]